MEAAAAVMEAMAQPAVDRTVVDRTVAVVDQRVAVLQARLLAVLQVDLVHCVG